MENLLSEASDYLHLVEVEILCGFIHDKIRNFEILMVVMYYIDVYHNFNGQSESLSEKAYANSTPFSHDTK